MRQRSFFLRLLLGNLLLVALIIGLGGWLAYRHVETSSRQQLCARQDALAAVLGDYFEHLAPAEQAQIHQACKRLAEAMDSSSARPAMRVTFIAADGRVLGDSQADPERMENHRTPQRPEVMQALAGQTGQSVHHSPTLGVEFRYLAEPVRHDGQIVGAVRLAMPLETFAHQRALIRNTLLWAALAASAAAVALGLLLSWLWYAPLKRITAAAGQIASGDLSARARITGPAELARLGTALNEMRDSLARQFNLIRAQRENLQTVVANLAEGVIAVDADGAIVLVNQAAEELLGVAPSAVGRPLKSVISGADIVDVCNQALLAGRVVLRQLEMERSGRRYVIQASAARISADPSAAIAALLVVRDVTDLARTAAVKAEFVANASHELRTPLAAIRAAVDVLAAGPGAREDFAKCLAILDRQVARLENLTNDLLELHRLERKEGPVKAEPVSLDDLAEWATAQFAASAAEKGVDFDVSLSRPGSLRSDRRLLELVLQNLIDNAIKFTPGGGKVRCDLEGGDAGVLFRVSDTGCGIRKQDLGRVFERFYQADAARSGEARTRGTGLGLAIVKHAAERLGAKVDLKSEWGKGTTVTVTVTALP